MELTVLNWIQTLRTGWLDGVMVSVSTLGDAGAVWIVLALVLLCIPRTCATTFEMGILPLFPNFSSILFSSFSFFDIFAVFLWYVIHRSFG